MKIKHVFFICTGLLAFSLINDIDFNKPVQNFNKDGHYQILQTEKAVPIKDIVEIAIDGQSHSDLLKALDNKANQQKIKDTNPQVIDLINTTNIPSDKMTVVDMKIDKKSVQAQVIKMNVQGQQFKMISAQDQKDVMVLDQKGDVVFLKDDNTERFAASAVSHIDEIRKAIIGNSNKQFKKG